MRIDRNEALLALIELGRDLEGLLREKLLIAAYRASLQAPSAVLLRHLDTTTADRILDPVVAEMKPGVAGLLYLRTGEERAFLEAGPRAEIVIASSAAIRDQLDSLGVPSFEPRPGLQALQESAGVSIGDSPVPAG